MITRATFRPGQRGAKRLTEKYGSRLVCVRYKYDDLNGKRYTTVELIEEEGDRLPLRRPPHTEPAAPHPSRPLAVRFDFSETALRRKVKAARTIWRPRQKLWEMPYDDVRALGLESRVVPAENPAPEESARMPPYLDT